MLTLRGPLLVWLALLPAPHGVHAAGGSPALDRCTAPNAMPRAYAVVVPIAGSDTLSVVTICLVTGTTRLRFGGYHGELSLPHSSRVVGVERPVGGTRIENTRVVGRVSFAGVASGGIGSGAVLGLTIARRSAADDARIRLTMIDVTDIAGREIAPRVAVDSLPRISGPQ